jgi:hypothetical protein
LVRVAPAQQGPDEAFGLGSQTTIIPAVAFVPGSNSYQYTNYFGDTITPSANGEQRWFANLNLPNGAVVDTLDVFVVDNDAGSDITVYADGVWFPISGSGGCSAGYLSTATSSGITGQGHVVISQPWQGDVTSTQTNCNMVDSYQAYEIVVYLETTNHAFSGARVVWHRVVSPPPGTPTFGDVLPSSPLFQFVEALAASGITSGCGGGNYCPNNPVTRGQMAVFMAKALGLYWPQ